MHRRHALLALPLLALAACETGAPAAGPVAGPAPVPAARPSPPFVVFFTRDSAALDPAAEAVIAEAATAAGARADQPVRVRGFAADVRGSAGFNRALSEARARRVADQLVARGIDRSRIRVERRGAVSPRDPSFPTEARRVEIAIGG